MRDSAFIFTVLWAIARTVDGSNSVEEEARIIEELFDVSKYNKDARPAGGPIEVISSLYIRNIESVDIKNQDFTVDVTFRQKWVDQRLQYSSHSVEYLTLPRDDMVWKPDTFFRNSKEAGFQMVPSKQFYVRVSPDGSVLYSLRLKLKQQCWMNLENFPFDSQECQIQIASYSHSSSTMYYTWKEDYPIQFHSVIGIPNMQILQYNTSSCDVRTSTGEYSCISVDLTLGRSSSYQVLTIYIPYTMFLCVAYTVFWLRQRESLLRLGIAVAMLLSAASKQEMINQELPPKAYAKSVDVWTGVCTFFIFCSFIVCVIIHCLQKEEVVSQTEKTRGTRIQGSPASLKIDYAARFLYPMIFIN